MSRTDRKKRKLAGAVGEPFIAIRRRMIRSAAWRSLSAPAIKIYCELRLRYRHKLGNNGQLFVALRECEGMGLSRGSAVRGFAELESKGFIVKTRQGEAGRLPRSGTLDNGGAGFARKATLWALTEEPLAGQPASNAYEDWAPAEEQVDVSAPGPAKGSPVDPSGHHGSTSGPVDAPLNGQDGSARGPSLSTIYTRRSSASPSLPHRDVRLTGSTRSTGTVQGSTPICNGEIRRGGWFGPRGAADHWPAPERRAAGLTQAQLAALSGVQRPYLATIERGKRNPSAAVRDKLAAGLARARAT